MAISQVSVILETDALVVERVPFAPSSLYGGGRVPAADIVEIDPTHSVARIVLRSGEFVPYPTLPEGVDGENPGPEAFVPTRQLLDPLIDFARRHRIALIEREDPWRALMTPFHTPTPTPGEKAQAAKDLALMGFETNEIEAIRRRVSRRVGFVGWTLGGWEHLDLFDVLASMERFNTAAGFAAFYAEAMAIARRGRVRRVLSGERDQEPGQPPVWADLALEPTEP